VPVPALVRLKLLPLSLITPLTVRAFAELLVQVWLAPRMTGALIKFAPEPTATVMPLPAVLPLRRAALIVRELVPMPEAIVEPAVSAVPVPENVRLLIVKFVSSVVLRLLAELAVKVTLVLRSGMANVSGAPLAPAAQLVVLPAPVVFHFPSP
jgi:hypothetical protein